jgi:chloramphenicol-sensitive protein RarD
MQNAETTSAKDYQHGLAYAVAAYGLWGLMPLYFRAVHAVDSLELLCHRVLWSVVFLLGLLMLKGELREAVRLVREGRTLRPLLLSAPLICGNWLLYIYAISTGRTLEASFGYFISPLVNIVLGVAVLSERLNRPQVACLALAAVGIAVRLWAMGTLPWIAIGLALTSGLYGLVRKRAGIPPVSGLAIETVLAMPAAILGLWWFAANGQLAFMSLGLTTDLLLASAGLITSIPLILFLAGTQRLPLSTIGFLQYLGPSLQFLIALVVFGEPLSTANLVSFCFIWAGLLCLVAGTAQAWRPSSKHPCRKDSLPSWPPCCAEAA